MTMAKGRKTRLGIILGGRSGEHEVSLTSAASVISALNPEEFEITAFGITKSGRLAGPDEVRSMLPEAILPRIRVGRVLESQNSVMRVTSSATEKGDSSSAPMIMFPLLHGPYGEDGTIQGLLEIAGIPYIGCGVLASAAGMDKDIMKRLFLQEGLPLLPYRTVLTRNLSKELETIRKQVSEEFGYPVFSKPANLGSSVGVCKIRSERELESALWNSAQFDRKIVIEKGIECRELECAILGNDEPTASVVGEVVSAHEFYDYDAKYLNPASRLEIPARIDAEKAEEIRRLAVRSFRAIDGAGLSRVDFFMERSNGRIWVNEINTMPGFTPISMYTKLWAASGIPFEELVRRLVRFGEERFRERNEQRISAN